MTHPHSFFQCICQFFKRMNLPITQNRLCQIVVVSVFSSQHTIHATVTRCLTCGLPLRLLNQNCEFKASRVFDNTLFIGWHRDAGMHRPKNALARRNSPFLPNFSPPPAPMFFPTPAPLPSNGPLHPPSPGSPPPLVGEDMATTDSHESMLAA